MRKQSPVRLLFIALSLFLLLPQTFVSGNARAVNMVYGAIQIENRNDADAAFSCDVRLSGKRIQGSVFAVLFSESEQMKLLSGYPASETVRVSLKNVSKTDYIKILWTDEQHMPLANPVVLRMEENNAAAYENFTKQLAASLQPYQGGSASSDAENPYALARLLVSCDALPDLSEYKGKATTVSGPDNLHILQFYDPAEASKCKNYLESFPSVRYVEPDAIMQANATESGASSSPHSWGVSKTGSGEYAENLRQRGDAHGVIVAVVDSGVESSHPFLKNRLIAGYDFIQYDEIPQDEHGHGTHVTGTIVDCTPDKDVKIMPVRVLDAFASGSYLSIANGIRYAADHGANIINLSLGSTNHSQTIDEAVNYALSKNITVVAAAGNKMGNVDYFCPAHMEDCITVAAVDSDLKRYELSNYGDAIDIAAPGVGIESSILKGKYGEMNGTSMATPHVSAAAALLMSERGTGQTPFQISSLLRDAATDVGEPGKDVYFGAGFLNMRPFIVHSAYAMLYADGELVFQKNNTPAPDRELIKSYPVATSGDGGGQYAAWHDRHSDIRKVTFAESIRPTSTALWFYGCENLSEVRGIENLDASGLTDMSQMFARCGSLKTLDLSGLDTGNVSKMNSMFFHCEGLTEVDLTDWNTKNVTDTRDMFIGCAALKSVYVSDSFSTEKMTDSEGMFQGCYALVGGQRTTYDNAHTNKEYARIDAGTSAPGYFTKNEAIAQGNCGDSDDKSNLTWKLYKNYNLEITGTGGMDKFTATTTWSGGSTTYSSSSPWFEYHENIRSVSINQGVTSIGNSAFWRCSNLRDVTIPDTVTSIGTAAFEECSELLNVEIPDSVTSIGQSAFSHCSKMEYLKISENISRLPFHAFSYCESLKSVTIPDKVTSTDKWVFADCSSLTSVRVPDRLTFLDTGVFSSCTNLTEIEVGSNNRRYVSLDGVLFDKTVTKLICYPAGKTNAEYVIPESVTEIEIYAFRESRVSKLTIPSSVTDIGSWAFMDCDNLSDVYYHGTRAQWNEITISTFYNSKFLSANLHFEDDPEPNPDSVYAILYSDGTLVFQHGDTPQSGRTVQETFNVNISDGYDEKILPPWHRVRENLLSVDFAEKIKPLTTAYWFSGCDNLVDIQHIENLDTSAVTDMSRMFSGCSKLTLLDLSSFKTSRVTDMKAMFLNCSNLVSLNVKGWDTSRITDMGGSHQYTDSGVSYSTTGIFSECSSLESLDLSSWDTSNVTNMSFMFYECTGLKSLNVSNWNTSKVTDMYGMFGGFYRGCSSLTELDVKNWDTSKVTDMHAMFDGCLSLTSLDLSKWNTGSVTNMGYMFCACKNLTALDIRGFDTTCVTSMASMFYECESLPTLDLSSFDTRNVTTMTFMFTRCKSLTALDVSSFNTGNVTDFGEMFYECTGLISLDLSHFDTSRATDMDSMFRECEKLTNLDVSNFNTSSVTEMDSMFSSCKSLKEVDVSGFDTSHVTDMAYMFSSCRSLENLDVSSFDTSNVTDMCCMFSGCRSLKTLDLSSFNTANLRDSVAVNAGGIMSLFSGCSNLTTIYASNAFVTNQLVTRGNNVFSGCSKLIGGAGTAYDSEHIDKTYAHIDGGTSNPGYFTYK